MGKENFFGLSADFVDTLNDDDLQKLNDAKKTIQLYQNKQKECSGVDENLRAYLIAQAEKRAAEEEACERVRSRFK